MAWLGGIHDLAYSAQRIYQGVGSSMSGDSLAAAANFGAAAGKAMWYLRNHIPKLAAKLKANQKPTPTYIVDLCMVAIFIVDFFNGFNAPEKGPELGTGKAEFKNVELYSLLARADSGKWSGTDADDYKIANDALRQLAIDLQTLDGAMKDQVAAQGAMVDLAHRNIALLGMSLVIAQGIALAMFFGGPAGAKASYIWQGIVVAATVVTLTASQTYVAVNQNFNGVTVNGKTEEYKAIKARAKELQEHRPKAFATKLADETEVASLRSFQGPPAVPFESRTVASLVEEAAPLEDRAVLKALMDDGATNGDGTPGDGETPDPAPKPDPAPPFQAPTLAQLSKASGQLAQISGHVSQHMNLMNQSMGQVQQIAQMFQGAQGAAAPAEEAAAEEAALAGPAPAEAALAEAVEGAGAGAGAEAAERAPVEVAAVGAESGTEEARRVL